MLFIYQTIIKFPWWSTMSRNSTIMLTHYAWPPNPLFDAIKFISTGNRSLLVFFFFLFFFYKGFNWQRGETKDLIIKKSSFVHFLSFDYQPLFGKWVCAHWGTNSRKRRELILLTTSAKIVGFGAARDVKPIRPLVKFFRKYLTIFSSTFSLVLLRSMPLSWVTLVSFAVVLFVARIIYDIS